MYQKGVTENETLYEFIDPLWILKKEVREKDL